MTLHSDGRDDPDDVEELRAQLAEATTSARDAYQNSTRLIRLLTVIGQPSSPEELVDQVLTVLSDVFSADVTCLVETIGSRLVVTSSCGIPEGDPAFVDGWPAGPAAREALVNGEPVATATVESYDVPSCMAGIGFHSAAWIPLVTGKDPANEMIVLYRREKQPFSEADLQVLVSVAYRLCTAVAARERGVAIERLAQWGHRLARHLDLQPLLDEAVDILLKLTGTDNAWIYRITGDSAELWAQRGPAPAWDGASARALPGWSIARTGRPYCEANLLCTPVMRDVVPVALLYARRELPRPFHRDTVEIANVLANYLGAAMANAELYRALAQSESSLRLITDSISDLIAVIDSRGTFAYASPSHLRELGYDPDEIVGRTLVDFIHPADRAALSAALASAAPPPKIEYRLSAGGGGWVWVESALRPAPSPEGSIVISSRMVDDRKRLEEELRRRATHDPLTGLANRALVGQRLHHALVRGEPGGIGVLFCDLDKFKAINDRLGHDAGDELLQQVAVRLRSYVRPTDLLGRFGGDEFVLVLDGVSGPADISDVGRRVLSALDEPFPLRGELVQVSASIGGVHGVRGKTTASAMLRDADTAMYAAKARGAGRVEVFDEVASRRTLDRVDLRSELLHALDRGQLSVHYQPIFALRDAKITGFEALLRWTHPRRGPIAPEAFIPLAEETGVIVPIGRWVLDQACRQLVEWRDRRSGDDLTISVNLSAAQLRQPDLAPQLLSVIERAGLTAADVWLEVTEPGIAQDEFTATVATMRKAGARFALDDFGLSFSLLTCPQQRFPADRVKIDRSFVAGMTELDTHRGVVRAILALADSLGLEVVAEGVETEAHWRALLDLGCQQGQGFLLSRPLPPEEASALLQAPALA